MKALIDGDMVIHMACAAQQLSFDDEEFFDVELAAEGAARMIRTWTKGAGCSRPIVCLSEGTNFRKFIYPKYKANREGTEKPKAFYDVKEMIETEYQVWAFENLEADDVMGIAGSRDPGNYVIVSRDKDMKTVPASVFNPDHDKKPVRVRPAVADQMFLKQAMTGDTVDGYPGIPKVGEVTAQEIILNPRLLVKDIQYYKRGAKAGQIKSERFIPGPTTTLWNSMVSYAAAKGMSEQELITQARVARILRSGDFNPDTRIVKLWHPSGNFEELHLDQYT